MWPTFLPDTVRFSLIFGSNSEFIIDDVERIPIGWKKNGTVQNFDLLMCRDFVFRHFIAVNFNHYWLWILFQFTITFWLLFCQVGQMCVDILEYNLYNQSDALNSTDFKSRG
jgi:hypothetical protein